MNRYILRQRFFKITDHYDIKDAQNNVRFVVRSKMFTIGKKFWLEAPNGQELFFIKQRLFRFLPRYDIYKQGNYVGKLKKRVALFVKRIKVTSEFGDFIIKGNVFAWDFKILDSSGNMVAKISKAVLKIADTYTVDVYAHDTFIMALVITLDSIFHPRR